MDAGKSCCQFVGDEVAPLVSGHKSSLSSLF